MIRLWLLMFLTAGAVLPCRATEAVAATYRLVTQAAGGATRESRFLLLRTDALVEVRALNAHAAERWERAPGGPLYYARIFTDLRRIVEFQPADFAAAGIPADWDTISTVTGHALLARLERAAGGHVDGRAVESFRGEVDGVRNDIDWLPDVDLPARVAREAGGQRSELHLVELQTGPAAESLFTPRDVLSSFETIDFADLGDRQGDPVVDRLVQASGLDLHEH